MRSPSGLKVAVESLDAERGRINLKLPWRKRDQRRADGLGDGMPEQLTSLIKVPAYISEKLHESLLEQANAWLACSQPLPPAMRQLLERRPIAELVTLNASIAAEPDSVASRLADFLLNASGITLSLQGTPGAGKSTVTGQVIAQLVASGKRVAISRGGASRKPRNRSKGAPDGAPFPLMGCWS